MKCNAQGCKKNAIIIMLSGNEGENPYTVPLCQEHFIKARFDIRFSIELHNACNSETRLQSCDIWLGPHKWEDINEYTKRIRAIKDLSKVQRT